ncbi:MAG: hypothetical protein ABL904_25645 [Hyphomicrobiaceae bacterium]
MGVDGWIRLHPADFAAMATLTERFVHFNLGTTSNVVGHSYAIVPIVRPGFRTAEGIETLPHVDVRRSRRGRCVEVRQAVRIEDVTAADFLASLPNLRSIGGLRSALIERYARMFPEHSDADILKQGCAITTLDLVGLADWR